MSSIKATLAFMAPEICRGKKAGRKADIWSLGCTALRVLSLKYLFDEETFAENPLKSSNYLPPLPSTLSPDAQSFIQWSLQISAEARPTALSLAEHPFVAGYGSKPLTISVAEPEEIPTPSVWTEMISWKGVQMLIRHVEGTFMDEIHEAEFIRKRMENFLDGPLVFAFRVLGVARIAHFLWEQAVDETAWDIQAQVFAALLTTIIVLFCWPPRNLLDPYRMHMLMKWAITLIYPCFAIYETSCRLKSSGDSSEGTLIDIHYLLSGVLLGQVLIGMVSYLATIHGLFVLGRLTLLISRNYTLFASGEKVFNESELERVAIPPTLLLSIYVCVHSFNHHVMQDNRRKFLRDCLTALDKRSLSAGSSVLQDRGSASGEDKAEEDRQDSQSSDGEVQQ